MGLRRSQHNGHRETRVQRSTSSCRTAPRDGKWQLYAGNTLHLCCGTARSSSTSSEPPTPSPALCGGITLLFPFYLAMLVHRAPRCLTNRGEIGPTIPATGRSIVPGCTISTSLARARILDSIDDVDTGIRTRLFQHVDDVSQMSIGRCPEVVIRNASSVGHQVAAAFSRNGVFCFSKTVVLGSLLRYRELHRQVADQGNGGRNRGKNLPARYWHGHGWRQKKNHHGPIQEARQEQGQSPNTWHPRTPHSPGQEAIRDGG